MVKKLKEVTAKGLPSITIELDKPRTLRWPHGSVREFEDMALKYLELPKAGNVRADTILNQTIANPTIQSYALYFALGGRADARLNEDKELSMNAVDDMITAYKEAGGDMDDLITTIQRSYLVTNDPSFLVSFEENLKSLHKLADLQKEINKKEETKRKKTQMEMIASLEKQLAEMDGGPEPSDSDLLP